MAGLSANPPGRDRRLSSGLATAVAAALVLWLYAAIGNVDIEMFTHGADQHYPLLAQGFLSGHLYLSEAPPPALLQLADPYNPAQNSQLALHDASLYHGHYYLYFGPAPAALLFAPFQAVTGRPLSQAHAIVFSCGVAFLAGALALRLLRDRFLPAASAPALFAATVLWGLVNWAPVLLRRPAVWEVAVACSFMCMMLGCLCLALRLTSARRFLWTALASLCFGLMFASRANTLFATPCVLLAVLLERRGRGLDRRELLAAASPLGMVVVAVFAYNYLRFGKWSEFGFTYILSGLDISHRPTFGLSNVPFNAYMFLWAPAQLSPYFPFFKLAMIPPLPAGHDVIRTGVEEMNGALSNMPVLFLALGALLLPRAAGERAAAVWAWLAAHLWLSAACAAVLFCFFGICSRYLSDFIPPLALLAATGCLAVWSAAFRGRWAARLGMALAALYSGAFVLGQSAEHGEILRAAAPSTYRMLAHALDYPALVYASIAGRACGPVELTILLPTDRAGRFEPLLSTGDGGRTDTVLLKYQGPHTVLVGLQRYHAVYAWSAPVELDYARPHKVQIALGSLYPPPESPFFDPYHPAARDHLRHSYAVMVDGQLVLQGTAEFSDAVSLAPALGCTRAWEQQGWVFSGTVMEVRRLGPAPVPGGAPGLF